MQGFGRREKGQKTVVSLRLPVARGEKGEVKSEKGISKGTREKGEGRRHKDNIWKRFCMVAVYVEPYDMNAAVIRMRPVIVTATTAKKPQAGHIPSACS